MSMFFQSFLTFLNSSRYRIFLSISDDQLLLFHPSHYWKDVFLDFVSVSCLLWFQMFPATLHFSPDHIQVLKLSLGFTILSFFPVHICLLHHPLPFFSVLYVCSSYCNDLHILPFSIIHSHDSPVALTYNLEWLNWASVSNQWCQLTFIAFVIILIFYLLWN